MTIIYRLLDNVTSLGNENCDVTNRNIAEY